MALSLELTLGGRKYTWANNESDPTYETLDIVLICPDWEEHYPLTIVQALERELSNHTPLVVDSREKLNNNAIFRFENSWMVK